MLLFFIQRGSRRNPRLLVPKIVNTYPHDIGAFTEGLFYYKGFLYEKPPGRTANTSVRKVKLETGEVLQKREVSENYFGEGIINWKDKLYQLNVANPGRLYLQLRDL